MLYELTKELHTELIAQGMPHDVIYGPEPVGQNGIARTRIVVERARGTNENFTAPKSQFVNPRALWNRVLAGTIRAYANSTLDGARTQDHERLADKMADAIACALYKVSKRRKNSISIDGGHMLSVSELEYANLQTWPGAVYEMSIGVDRSVLDLSWAELKRAEGTFAGIANKGEFSVGLDTVSEDMCANH